MKIQINIVKKAMQKSCIVDSVDELMITIFHDKKKN